MMRIVVCSFSLVWLFLFSNIHPALANLLNNGGFEAPVVTSSFGYQTIPPGFEPSGFGWRVVSGNVDITVNGAFGVFRSLEGRQFLDLDGTVPGSIAQNFATTPGVVYVLTFYYANNFGAGGTVPARATVRVFDTISGANLVTPLSLTHGTSSAADMQWTAQAAMQFIAQSTTTTVSFTSNDPSGDGGMFIDAVSVDPVPIPNFTHILPQLVFGGGWYSALYFTNTTSGPVSFGINFVSDNGSPLFVPSVGGSWAAVNLAPRGTTVIEALNSGPLTQGYATASLPSGVVGYGVFRQTISGLPDQEAVVPLSRASSTTSTLIWDDTAFATGVAIANVSSAAITVSITVRDATGTNIGNATVSLPANGKRAFFLRELPGSGPIAGKRGSADFTAAIGNIAVLGLRFNGPAITSIPTADR